MGDERPGREAVHVRLLLVAPSTTERDGLTAAFESVATLRPEVVHADTLEAAVERLAEHDIDLVLLDLELPDSSGVATFAKVQACSPSLPILVLTSSDQDPAGAEALAHGALDYLGRNELIAPVLERTIRYALDRARLLAELRASKARERELRSVERLSTDAGTSVTAQMYSGAPLREAAPELFDGLVDDYSEILDIVLEHRVHRDTCNASNPLRELGNKLGFLHAKPRDVIDLHTFGLRRRLEGALPARAQALVEEGRLTALELMGNLARFYRVYYRPPTTLEKAAHE